MPKSEEEGVLVGLTMEELCIFCTDYFVQLLNTQLHRNAKLPPASPKGQPEMAAVGLPRLLHADRENTQITGYATQWCTSLLPFSSTETTKMVNITSKESENKRLKGRRMIKKKKKVRTNPKTPTFITESHPNPSCPSLVLAPFTPKVLHQSYLLNWGKCSWKRDKKGMKMESLMTSKLGFV